MTTVSDGIPKVVSSRLCRIRLKTAVNRIVGNPAFIDEYWFENKDDFTQRSVIAKNKNIVKESLKKTTPYTTYNGEIKNITSFFGWICPRVDYQIHCYKREEQIWICWNYTFQIGSSLKGLYFLWFMKKKVYVNIEKLTCQAIAALSA